MSHISDEFTLQKCKDLFYIWVSHYRTADAKQLDVAIIFWAKMKILQYDIKLKGMKSLFKMFFLTL